MATTPAFCVAPMDHPATDAFRRAAPFALLPVAPALAARYVSRARLISPSCTFPDSCPKCGTYLLDGSGEIRVHNNKNPFLHRLCLVCRKLSVIKVAVARESPSSSHPVESAPPKPPRHRRQSAQQTGLQQLLFQNKKKEELKQTTENTVGLAAFLADVH